MTELNEKEAPKKAAPEHEAAHELLNDQKAAVPEKHEAAGDAHKDSTASPAAKLYESITPKDHQDASWKQLLEQSKALVSGAAAEMLSLNPLGDLSALKLGAHDGKDAGHQGGFHPGNIGSLNGVWKDIFAPENTKPVSSFEQMGKPGIGNSVAMFDGIDLSDALMTSYDTQAVHADSSVTRASSSGGGFLGSLFNEAKDFGSKVWNEAKDIGGEIWDGAKTVGNATVSWFGDSTSTSDKVISHEVRETTGGKVETLVTPDKTVFKTSEDVITQSHADADGKHNVSLTTKDGRTLSQDKDTGIRTASNEHSDIILKEDPKTGKVEALDKSGNQVAQFNNRGDASRFFDNSTVQIVQPGRTLDEAMKAFQQEHPDKLKDKPLLLMDGKGESLTVRPDGSIMRTHPNGDAEATFKHVGHDGKEHEMVVRVTEDKDGKEHISIGPKDGPQHEISSQEAANIMAGTHLRRGEHGGLEISDDDHGDPSRPPHWRQFIRDHKFDPFDGARIDLRTGVAVIDDPKTHAVITPDKETGVTTMQETTRHPDGSLDANPSRLWTMDHGKVTTQGEDPITGQPNKNDLVTYDSHTGTLNAWDMVMTPTNVDVKNENGDHVKIDPNGDVNVTDRHGNSYVQTRGDDTSYDGGKTYHNELTGATYDAAQHETEQAKVAADRAALIAQSIDAHIGAAMSLAELAALEGTLDAAIARCHELGIPIPAQVTSARGELGNLRAKLVVEEDTKKKVQSEA